MKICPVLRKKAQLTVEWYIIIILLLVVFLFFVKDIDEKAQQLKTHKDEIQAKALADTVAFQVNQLLLSGEGSSKTFFLPDTLDSGTTYIIHTMQAQNEVEIIWSGRRYLSPVLTWNISASTIMPGQVNILLQGGAVQFDQ